MKITKISILFLLLVVCSVTMLAERQTIVLTESGLPYRSQVYFSGNDIDYIYNQISKYYDQHYEITSAAYTACHWIIVMSQDAGYGGQTMNFSLGWPKPWVDEQRDKGFSITSLATDGTLWLVVMSKDSHISRQAYQGNTLDNLKPWIQEQRANGFYITETAFDGTNWMVVMSLTDDIIAQYSSVFSGDIKTKIKEKSWDKGFCIQSLNYGAGQFFLVGCKYAHNNDRHQSYCIRENPTDFINSQGREEQMIAYAGGGMDKLDDNRTSSLSIAAFRTAEPLREKHLAALTWLNNESVSYQKNFSFKVGVKSDSKIEEVKVYVNGELDRGIVPVMDDGYDMTINRTVTLASGMNTIKVIVSNADGDATSEHEVKYEPKRTPSPVSNERRLALVIGNSNYHDPDKNLKNPVNDATDLSRKLESLGFTVIRAYDKGQKDMEMAINDFGKQLKNYDVGLFYYAGHGMRCKGFNYLIPTDADMEDEDDVKYKCVNANLVLDKMDNAHCPMKIIILDACRNNPFTRGWHRGSEEEGLGSMIAPRGTFIAFSTAPGEVAQDGKERNSPYTKAILQTMDTPNLSLMDFFQEVLIQVSDETNERQTPWTSNSFKGKFYFNKQ